MRQANVYFLKKRARETVKKIRKNIRPQKG